MSCDFDPSTDVIYLDTAHLVITFPSGKTSAARIGDYLVVGATNIRLVGLAHSSEVLLSYQEASVLSRVFSVILLTLITGFCACLGALCATLNLRYMLMEFGVATLLLVPIVVFTEKWVAAKDRATKWARCQKDLAIP